MFGNKNPDEVPVPKTDLNTDVDLTVKANCFASSVFPKAGELVFGDKGVEFRASSGVGYVQIPWGSIDKVVCDIIGKYVRAVEFYTEEAAPINFVVADGSNVLRCIAHHIGRDKLVPGPNNLVNAPHNIATAVKGVFKRKDKSDK
jgi:hypothetical protein